MARRASSEQQMRRWMFIVDGSPDDGPVGASLLQHSLLRYRCNMLRRCVFPRWPRMLCALLVTACGSASVQAAWITREAAIMGTRCAVELWSEDVAAGEAAIEAVFAEMRRIDALMSTYKPESEISRVNLLAAEGAVAISAELYELIEASVEYSRLSGGAFDIIYASVGYLYDYRNRERPAAAAIE